MDVEPRDLDVHLPSTLRPLQGNGRTLCGGGGGVNHYSLRVPRGGRSAEPGGKLPRRAAPVSGPPGHTGVRLHAGSRGQRCKRAVSLPPSLPPSLSCFLSLSLLLALAYSPSLAPSHAPSSLLLPLSLPPARALLLSISL